MTTPLEKCEETIAKLQTEITKLQTEITSFSDKSALLDKLSREIASFEQKLATKEEINALTQKLDNILAILQKSHESEGDRYFQDREYDKAIFEYAKAVKFGQTNVQAKIEKAQKKTQECIYLQLQHVQLELVKIPNKTWLMGKYPVTQEEYEAVMGNNPSNFKGSNRPVETVSWNDAQEFCRQASSLSGRQVRLPSEIEWEYAARAGTTTEYFFGNNAKDLDKFAWYSDNSDSQTHPVGTKQPNPWGLYDMLGNVWEWCLDWYDQTNKYKVLRGGSWCFDSSSCRCAYRNCDTPDFSVNDFGFRVVVVPQ